MMFKNLFFGVSALAFLTMITAIALNVFDLTYIFYADLETPPEVSSFLLSTRS